MTWFGIYQTWHNLEYIKSNNHVTADIARAAPIGGCWITDIEIGWRRLACHKLPIKVVYDLEVTEYDFHNNDSFDLNLSASDEESTRSKTN